MSCPSASLCVGGDGSGNVVTSTDPTGGRRAWKIAHIASTEINGGGCAENGTCFGVSCPSVSLCVAVDGVGNVLTSNHPAGGARAWRTSNAYPGGDLRGVSCPSVSLCVAFSGRNIVTSTDPSGGVTAWNSAPVSGYAIAGSCPTVSLCVVIDASGDVLTSTDPTGGPGAWTVTNIDPGGSLRGISCPSVSLCVGVGAYGGRVFTSTNPTGGSAAWTTFDAPGINGSSVDFTGLSCASVALCVAIDSTGDVATSTDPTGGAGAWVSKHILAGNPLVAISCPSESFCGAVDSAGVFLSTSHPEIVRRAWSVGGPALADTGVSCPTASLCVTTDSAGEIAASADPSGGPSTWSAGATFPPSESGGLMTASPATGVSCASASLCVAVGHGMACSVGCFPSGPGYLASTTDPTGGPSAWSVSTLPQAPALTAVACPSSTLCVAVDDSGTVGSSTNPAGGASAWKVVAVERRLDAISCASTRLCVAVDNAGNAFISTHPTGVAGAWRRVHLSGQALTGVSCASGSLCVAVGGTRAFVSARPTGDASAWISDNIDPAAVLNGVSCPSVMLCIATDAAGNTLIGASPSQAQIRAMLRRQIAPRRRVTANRLVRDHGYTLHFTAPTPGALTIDWYAVQKTVSGRPTRVLIATSHRKFTAAVAASVRLLLTPRGAALLRHANRLHLISKARFKPTHQSMVTATARFTLHV